MNLLNKSMSLVRQNAVLIVIVLMAVLLYTQRKSFAEADGKVKHCNTLCKSVLQEVPEGGFILDKTGAVTNSEGEFPAGGKVAVSDKKRMGCGSCSEGAPRTRR